MGARYVGGKFAFVSADKASSLRANLAHPGDLVFTQRGTLGQVSIVPDGPYDRYLVSQSQMKATVDESIANQGFVYHVFTSPIGQRLIQNGTIQTGVPHINLGILRRLPLDLPAVREQEAIAEALSDADALIESIEALTKKKRLIKQGAMQELLTGKKRLPGFESKPGTKQTEVGEIPVDWDLQEVSGVAVSVSSGTSHVDDELGAYPVHGSTGVIGQCHSPDYTGRVILVARVGANAGRLNMVDGEYGVTDNTIILVTVQCRFDELDKKWHLLFRDFHRARTG